MKKRFLSFLLAVCLLLSLIPAAGAASALTETAAEAPLTRGEALAAIWQAEGSPAPASAETPFTDLDGSPYQSAVAWAVGRGITNGVSATLFAPDDPVTRTQIAAFLYRAAGEPGKTGEGVWYTDALRWALGNIALFGGALPQSTSGDDTCTRKALDALLERRAGASDAEGGIYILYTSDVHCGVDQGFGYAGLAEIRAGLEAAGYATILVDDGDSAQGEPIGGLTQGETIIGLMNTMRYDLAIPGNHEFEYGTEQLMKLTETAAFPYLSCNFRKNGEPVFAPYRILEAAGRKIAFVGVTTPWTLRSADPHIFMNDAGEFLYDFLNDETGEMLYTGVQDAVDAARAEGADLVYVLGHLGNEANASPWNYADVIAHTVGIDVFLDGHSHDTDQITMKNAAGDPVVRSACGTKMSCVGYSRITADGKVAETGIWSWTNPTAAPEVYAIRNEIRDAVDAAEAEVDALLGEVFSSAEVTLRIDDPETTDASGNPVRMIRRAETNLGDFATDAMRAVTDADIGLWNGGGLRTNLGEGGVTHRDILNIAPFGNELCVIEATGQMILDALEWGARAVPGETGAFLQASGMTYEIDTSVPSGCKTDEKGICTGIEGARRVNHVRVGGEPIDPQKLYTVAALDFLLLNNGDGQTAFDGAAVIRKGIMNDTDVLERYITDTLGGVIGKEYEDPSGEGRIILTNGTPTAEGCSLIHEPEFGGIYITKTIEEFNALGFVYGDSVDIAFSNGVTLTDLPYYSGYYTKNGEQLLVAYPGYDYIKAAINNGDDLWVVLGLDESMTATVTLNTRGRYRDVQEARDIHYEDDRTLFTSDEEFANFRSIRAGKLKENTVYRSASPCDNQHNRATYTDALMTEAGVKFILNLADNEAKIEKYMAREDFACPGFTALYEAGQVLPVAMNMNFASAEFRAKIAAGFTALAQNEGPYLIHCTEGKDRTGFVCMVVAALAGASWDEIEADYMITYDNYYGITKESEKYDVIVENVLVPMAESMAGEGVDVKTADLSGPAEKFLADAGMTAEDIALLKSRLMD